MPLARATEHATVTTDGHGNAFVGNAVTWTDPLPAPGAERFHDVLLSSVDTHGNARWTVRTAGVAPTVTHLLATGDGGVTVTFRCMASVLTGAPFCVGGGDAVAARFDAAGSLRWTVPAEGVLDSVMGERGELYQLIRGEAPDSTAGRLVGYDSSGRRLGSSPARTSGCDSLVTHDDEVWAMGVEASPDGGARIRIARKPSGRWDLDAWEIPFPSESGRVYNPDQRCPAWTPDGDLYVVRGSDEIGDLQRLGPRGELRWSRRVFSLGRPFVDVVGNACVSTLFAAGRSNPGSTSTYCRATNWQLSVYAPNGGLRATHFRGQFDPMPGDQCPTNGSAQITTAIEHHDSSWWTVGDRTDAVTRVPTLVRYIRDTPPVCPAGQHRCGTRCVDAADDLDHCGACDRRCVVQGAVGRCLQGHCVAVGCAADRADCDHARENGCEADLLRSSDHCGACGRACAGTCQDGLCCVSGACRAPFASDGHEGPFEPTRDVTLRAGVHHFTTVTIPGGVTVHTDGDGVLELRATGDVVIDGAIDLSGGDGETPTGSGLSLPGGGGGHTARPGAAPPGESGLAGGGGAGATSVGLPLESNAMPLRGAAPGGGIAGGASGQAGSSGSCTRLPTITYGSDPDDGRAATRSGGRAWGVPYDGRGSPDAMSGCNDVTQPGGRSSPEYFTTAILAGSGSIGRAAATDLAVMHTFGTGSGGGGAGSVGCTRTPGAGGGGGGGALRVASSARIRVGATGRLLANGGRGGTDAGSGSGGVIYLAAPEVRVSAGAVVEAVARGVPEAPVTGIGRIRLSVDPSRCTLDGRFNPPLAEGCRLTPDGGVVGRAFVASWPR